MESRFATLKSIVIGLGSEERQAVAADNSVAINPVGEPKSLRFLIALNISFLVMKRIWSFIFVVAPEAKNCVVALAVTEGVELFAPMVESLSR